jgi:excisionase family DNA binding protein
MAPRQQVLSAQQAAEFLQLPEHTVLEKVEEGAIPGACLFGEWRFSRRQLLGWLEDMAIPEELVERSLVEEAERRVAASEGTVSLEEVRARLGL